MKEPYFHFTSSLGLLFASFFVFLILLGIWNVFQKEHTILRNFPLIGYVRYISESLGVYLRHFFLLETGKSYLLIALNVHGFMKQVKIPTQL